MSLANTVRKDRHILKSVAAISLLVIAGVALFGQQQAETSGDYKTYQDELARIKSNIQQLDPADPRYAYKHVQLAQLTGDFADFTKADSLLEKFP